MVVFKLLKFYTDAKALGFIIIIMAFTLSLQAQADEELAESMQVQEFRTCDQRRGEVTRIERELNQACREADLGNRSTCIQTLRECEGENAEHNDQCVAGMTTEDDVQRDRERLDALKEQETALQSRIQENQGTIDGLAQEALAINESKIEARANLEQALAEVGNARAEAQALENENLEKLEIAVDQARDQLVIAELGFREFVLSKVDECHEKADQHRQATYNNYQQVAQRGRARYSQASLFRMTGMSVQEISRIQGSNMMRRCMRMRSSQRDGNHVTPYGRRYQLERDKIEAQKTVLNRTIQRMEDKQIDVQRANDATMASLSEAERGHISNHQSEVLALNQAGADLVRREQVAYENIRNLQIESIGLMMDINAMENELQRNHGEGIRVASDDTLRAYREAQQSADSLLSAARMAENSAERCGAQSWIAGILEDFENADRASRAVAAEDIPAIDVEIEDGDAAEVAADDVRVGAGQTVN